MHKDVSDWVETGHRRSELEKLVKSARRINDERLAKLARKWNLESAEDDTPVAATIPWPKPLGRAALRGIAGDFVRMIAPHTEADSAALLSQFLVGFGNVIGRNPYFQVEATQHHSNLFAVLVGTTAKGRKGTSESHVRAALSDLDGKWRIVGGLASGEGLIWHVRDATNIYQPIKKRGRTRGYEAVEVPGIDDKRMLIIEPEYARVLQVCSRDTNTLSPVMRQGWDGDKLTNLTKNESSTATGAHISFIGHVTRDENRKMFSDTSMVNGFANRFLWVCVRRSKLLPDGGKLDAATMEKFQRRLREVGVKAQRIREMNRSRKARALWRKVYPKLSDGKPGMLGAATSRAEAQVTRLSCIYALLDGSATVRTQHLKAALEVWRYCEESARFIFGDALGDPMADEILQALRSHKKGMTRNDIREHFQRNKSSEEISRALGVLAEQGIVSMSREKTKHGQKRPAERWTACEI